MKLPTWLEILAFVLGIAGGLFFVIPAEIYNFFRCIFCCICCEKENGKYQELQKSSGSSKEPYISAPKKKEMLIDEPYSPGGPYFSPVHEHDWF